MNFPALAAIVVASLAAALVYRRLSKPHGYEPDPVNRLWRAALSPACESVYNATIAEVDCAFAMFGVALNDALSAREEGPEQASRLLEMSIELLGRYLDALESLLKAVERTSRSLHRLPQVRPLSATNFRSASAVGLARRQALLHAVLLGSRMRFFHKLDGIARAARQVVEEYEEAAESLLDVGARASTCWQTLDHAHYDLNTLWRETQIVFKAVLHFASDEFTMSLPGQFRVEMERREAARRPAVSRTHSHTP